MMALMRPAQPRTHAHLPADGLFVPLVADVRGRRRSAVGLVREALDRIDAARDLNAVIRLRAEAALAEAQAIDDRTRGAPETLGPLAGLPMLVKDIEDVAGLPTTYGSLLYADAPPAAHDGLVPRRLRTAGAIVVGKTNTPEFAWTSWTANRLFGATRNPWAPAFSPGGSSGGSSAALSAGLVPIATATDGGGSIRIPASLTGLIGIKPTNGVIARETFPSWIDLSTDGPMATTVADLALLLELEAGPDVGDPIAQQLWRLGPWQRPARVYAARRLAGDHPLDPVVETMYARALTAIEADLGLPVELVEHAQIFPSGVDPLAWFPVGGPEHAHAIGRETIERHGDQMDPGLRRWLEAGLDVSMTDHQAGRRLRHRYTAELEAFLAGDAVLVTPTLAVPGWSPDGVPAGAVEPGLPLWAFNTEHLNLTGHPAMALPAGRFEDGAATGLPFGIQVIGPRFREGLLFGFAAAWEEARPWPLVADGYRVFGS